MSEEFRVLDDREHVLLRPAMYAGSTMLEAYCGIVNYVYQEKKIVPALIKIIEEIYQNSIEEFVKTDGKFATKISIDISNTLEGPEITISDNGRGIPCDIIDGMPRPLIAWTKLRAGTNFDDSTRKGASANGLGSVLTNIFSSSFIGTSCDGKSKIVVTCDDNMKTIKHKVSTPANPIRGVTVKFIPDLAKFGLTEFTQDHIDVLKDRISNLAVMYHDIVFSFNGEKIKFKNIKQVAKQFNEAAISVEGDNFAFVFAPSGADEEFRCLSYVNGIYVKNGGTHVDYVLNNIISSLRDFVKKKYKIEVPPNQIKQHVLFASWLNNFPNLKFDSQTKERITNSYGEVSAVLGTIDYEKIAKQILNTPAIIDPMIEAILYKKEMSDKLALAKKQKSAAKVRVVNHIAATDSNPENKMLLLCEGLSAIGSLICVRNPKTVGGYPLRGKPLNVRGMKHIDIIKNKEISELMSIIGLELGKPAVNLELFNIEIDGINYIVGKSDIIIHQGKEIAVSTLL